MDNLFTTGKLKKMHVNYDILVFRGLHLASQIIPCCLAWNSFHILVFYSLCFWINLTSKLRWTLSALEMTTFGHMCTRMLQVSCYGWNLLAAIVGRWVSHPSKPLVLSLFLTVPWLSLWNRGNIFKLGRLVPVCSWPCEVSFLHSALSVFNYM